MRARLENVHHESGDAHFCNAFFYPPTPPCRKDLCMVDSVMHNFFCAFMCPIFPIGRKCAS